MSQPKKIAVISSEYLPRTNAEAAWAHQYCMELSARGDDVELFTTHGVSDSIREEAPFVIVDSIKKWGFGAVRSLAKTLKQQNYDIVVILYVCHMYDQRPWISFLPHWLKKHPMKVITVLGIARHVPFFTNDPKDLPKLFKKIYYSRFVPNRWYYGTFLSSDNILVLCQDHKDMIASGSSQEIRDKITIIPPPVFNFIPTEKERGEFRTFRQKLNLTEDTIALTFLGNIYRGKGIEYILEAMVKICKQYNKVQLFVVGSAGGYNSFDDDSTQYFNELKDLVRKYELEDNVTWTGFISDWEDVSKHLCACDIGVLPFNNGVRLNNSSYSYIAAHGLPVITTQAPGTDEHFRRDNNVLFCEASNAESIAENVLDLINDTQKRTTYAQASLDFYDKYYSWDRVVAWSKEGV